MISVQELIYEFKLNMNKVNRQENVDIPVEDIIVYLNKAQMSWIKTRLNQNNIYKSGFESIRKRIDDLQALKEENVKLSPTKSNDLLHIGYECPLSDAKGYMFYLSSYAKAKKNNCSKILQTDLIRNGELTTKYINNNYDIYILDQFEAGYQVPSNDLKMRTRY